MYTLYLNQEPFSIESFNRTIWFNEYGKSSDGSFTLFDSSSNTLEELGETTITSLTIFNQENIKLYDAGIIDANITQISENLDADRIVINVNLRFN